MLQTTHVLQFKTQGKGLFDVTGDVRAWVKSQSIKTGLLTLFCQHTSASLLIQENAAPEVRADLESFFDRLAPEDPGFYEHDDEGPDDMPAHLKTALTNVSLSIPVLEGQPALEVSVRSGPY